MNTLQRNTEAMTRQWLTAIEAAMRALGIDETNAHECELRQHEPTKAELYRNGIRLATFTADITSNTLTVTTTPEKNLA